MTKSLKQRWLKALKSGRYQKGAMALIDSDGSYCCLGVLGKVCKLSNEKLHDMPCIADPETSNTLLSKEFSETVGLDLKVQETLSEMNDESETFQEKVIPWIEKNL